MKYCVTAAFLFVAFSAGTAEAKTLSYPSENPQFSVAVPDDWDAGITNDGIISAVPKGAPFAISIFNTESKTLAGAVAETRAEVDKRFTDVTPAKVANFSNRQHIRFLEHYLSGQDKGSARSMLIAAFTIDGKDYFALFQAGTPEGTKRYGPDLDAILKSIAPLSSPSSKRKAERGD
jgi:hypothetical protein